MLVASGVGDVIGHLAVNAQISPILLAWLVAAVIRIATGSATVATITGAGIVVPVIDLIPGVNRELLVLATGAGSLILSHVNDAGFWLVKQYFNMSVSETFQDLDRDGDHPLRGRPGLHPAAVAGALSTSPTRAQP